VILSPGLNVYRAYANAIFPSD